MATTKAAPAKGKAVASTSKAVAKVEPKATAVGMPSAMASKFLAHAGAGLENASANDYALPFIYLLQKMSPQVDEDNEKFVKGAKAGMFYNTVSGALYETLLVVPVDFEKVYNEWIPRDAGGGFVATYQDKGEAEQNKQDNTQIVDTGNHYVLVQEEDGSFGPAILSLTSTKLKASRNWLSRIAGVMITGPKGKEVAPSFSRFYEVTKQGPITNQKGTFYTIAVNPVEGEDGWVSDDELFEKALDFRAQLKAGKKGADYNRAGETVVEGETDDDSLPM